MTEPARPESGTQRPEAVLINPGEGKSSGEVLRFLRSGLQPEDLGAVVKATRTARKGGLLIEFEGPVKNRSTLGNKITEAAGAVGNGRSSEHVMSSGRNASFREAIQKKNS
ncbi:unnamed protein product [Parnassius mnemosyne]|uniref:Uncharacterized protein n=1 Tax=Parnassius mnemosyne TaxID=213953 RepID=A0AAV1KFA9_9NEOP